MDQQPQLHERYGGVQLSADPGGRQDDGGGEQTQHPNGRPAPHAALGDGDQQRGERPRQQQCTEIVRARTGQVPARGHRPEHADQGAGGDDRPEPEALREAELVGDEAADRIADPDARRGADRQQGDRRAALLGGEIIAGDRHGHRQQAHADALQGTPGDEHSEAVGHRSERAAQHHDDQAADQRTAAVGTVAEPAEDRRADRRHQQGDRQGPLCAGDRHVGVIGDRRDQWRAE